jgi:hypothetical protein
MFSSNCHIVVNKKKTGHKVERTHFGTSCFMSWFVSLGPLCWTYPRIKKRTPHYFFFITRFWHQCYVIYANCFWKLLFYFVLPHIYENASAIRQFEYRMPRTSMENWLKMNEFIEFTPHFLHKWTKAKQNEYTREEEWNWKKNSAFMTLRMKLAVQFHFHCKFWVKSLNEYECLHHRYKIVGNCEWNSPAFTPLLWLWLATPVLLDVRHLAVGSEGLNFSHQRWRWWEFQLLPGYCEWVSRTCSNKRFF